MKLIATILAISLAGMTAYAEPARDEDVAAEVSWLGTIGATFLVIDAGNHTSSQWRTSTIELAGAVLAPGIGHAYAGDWLSLGLGLRVGGAALAIAGAIEMSRPYGNSTDFRGPLVQVSPLGGFLALGGLVALATGAIYDVATARREVRRYNRLHPTVTPTAMASASGMVPGVSLVGAF